VIRAIILAAGDSTRMGAPKAVLPDGSGRLFITRLIHTFAEASFRDIVVVTGTVHDRIVSAVADNVPRGMSVSFARNEDPSRGQLSSLLVGLDVATKPGTRAVIMTLVDVPFVSASTVMAVVNTYEKTNALIVRPAQGTRHGHPVLFDASLFAELRMANAAAGAKAVVRAHVFETVNVETTDEGAFIDVDTRDEYERAVRS
jgi:molybdenum cofactor cytidylyltransferase